MARNPTWIRALTKSAQDHKRSCPIPLGRALLGIARVQNWKARTTTSVAILVSAPRRDHFSQRSADPPPSTVRSSPGGGTAWNDRWNIPRQQLAEVPGVA